MFTLKRSAFAPLLFTTILLLFVRQLPLAQNSSVAFDRAAYYAAFASDNMNTIQKQLDIIRDGSQDQKDAFEGALMMKKAGLIKGASHKLKEFKAGREKLEHMIAKYAGNAEFRFLRLMIQEKAPKILGYDKQIEKDHRYVADHFKTIPEAVKKAILDYSKSSKVLSPEDF